MQSWIDSAITMGTKTRMMEWLGDDNADLKAGLIDNVTRDFTVIEQR